MPGYPQRRLHRGWDARGLPSEEGASPPHPLEAACGRPEAALLLKAPLPAFKNKGLFPDSPVPISALASESAGAGCLLYTF